MARSLITFVTVGCALAKLAERDLTGYTFEQYQQD